MKNKRELTFNIYVLLVVFGLNILGDTLIDKESIFDYDSFGILLSVTFFTTSILIYYVNYTICIPKFIVKKHYFKYLLSFIALIILFALIRFFLEEVVVFNLTGNHNYYYNTIDKRLLTIYFFDSFYYTLRICLLSGVISLIFRYIESKERVHQLEMESAQAKVSMLRSQISPHFLFNTLNGFYSDLYDDKPEVAKDILKLSQLLRYVTYEVKQNFMPLNNELDFIKDYLYFYKKRYEDDFYVNLSIDGQVSEQPIPALILVHFIENVCKHGTINNKDKPAKIKIKVGKDALEVVTVNYINTSEKYMEKGIGTDNIKNRLVALFKDDFQLDHTYDDSQFKAYLKMPI